MVDGGHVHPDLVGPTGLQVHLEQRGADEGVQRVVVGDAGPAGRGDGHLVLRAGVPPDGRVDGADERVRVALHQRVVRLVDRTGAEGALQPGVGELALGHHHQPRGADVEPLDDALPLRHARRWRSGSRRPPGGPARSGRSSRHSGGRPRRPACRPPRCRRRRRRSSGRAPSSAAPPRSAARPASPRASRPRGPGRTWRRPRRPPAPRRRPTRSATRLRDSPSIRATAASTRSPSSPSGTSSTRASLTERPRPASTGPGAPITQDSRSGRSGASSATSTAFGPGSGVSSLAAGRPSLV